MTVARLMLIAALSCAVTYAAPSDAAPLRPWGGALTAPTQKQRVQARKLAGEAMDLFAAGDYATALEKFQGADAIADAPTLKLRIARCLDKLDRLAEASEVYRQVIAYELTPTSKAVYREARKKAVPELAALRAQVPSVLVTVAGPNAGQASVSMGDEPVADDFLGSKQPLDPGYYVFTATLNDRQVTKDVDLQRGQHARVQLMLPAPNVTPQSTQVAPAADGNSGMWIGGWVAIGIGGVGLVMGAVTGGMVLADESDLESRCPNRECPPDVHDDAESFDTKRTLSTVGFIIGGLGAAVGTTLLLLASGSDSGEQAIQPIIGPGGAGVRVRF
jgi:tetratricopeptide (TPR) repeat protein